MTTAFRDAHEWATGATGVGVLADEGELSWKNKVRQRFDCYYEVVDIMADRAGSMPKCTNDDPRNLDLDDESDGPDFPFVDGDDDEEDDGSVAVVADSAAAVVVDAEAAAAAPVPAFANKKAPPTSESKKKPRKRGGRSPLMDDETLKAVGFERIVCMLCEKGSKMFANGRYVVWSKSTVEVQNNGSRTDFTEDLIGGKHVTP